MINYALYLAHYDAYFHIHDDTKKCRYFVSQIILYFLFFNYSFQLLPHKVLLEVCFAMIALIKIIYLSI